MSNFKIGCKTVSIITAVYGWFIPFTLIPSFSQEHHIQIEEDLPKVFQMDIDSLFDFEEVVEEVDDNDQESEENLLEAITPPTKRVNDPSSVKRKEPLPQQTDTPSKKILVSPPSSLHPFQKVQRNNTTRKIKRKEKRKTKRCTSANPDITLLSKSSGKGTYSLPKSLVTHYSRNWKEANRLANLAWSTNKQGDVRGIKIRHIYCKSPLRYSGLKKGDIVLSVNGTSINSNVKLIRLLPKIRFWKKIELEIIRRGKPLKLEYSISK